MEYNSIFELDDVLNDLHIDHIFRPMFDEFQIIVESNKYRVSFIEYMGSYGSSNDLIEAWDAFARLLEATNAINYYEQVMKVERFRPWN